MHSHPLCLCTLINTSSSKIVLPLTYFIDHECHTPIFCTATVQCSPVLDRYTQLFGVVLCIKINEGLFGCTSLAYLNLSLSGAHGAILLRI